MKSKHYSIPKIKKYIQGKWAPRRPKSKKEEQEFGKSLKDLIICSECKSIYTKKKWIYDPLFLKSLKKTKTDLGLNVEDELRFSLCPACKMIKDKMFEGEITIFGFEEKDRAEILKIAKNVNSRAFQKDPLDRISEIKDLKDKLIIYTTENKLALLIAKQIQQAFKRYNVKKEIKFSHEEDVVRVNLRFEEKKKKK